MIERPSIKLKTNKKNKKSNPIKKKSGGNLNNLRNAKSTRRHSVKTINTKEKINEKYKYIF